MSDDPGSRGRSDPRGDGRAARRAPVRPSAACSAARSGAGVRVAATITIAKARVWSAMPSASPGIGSPKTTSPPVIAETLAAALVT